jgi:selenocysteine-specific elongation factor
MFAIDHCF